MSGNSGVGIGIFGKGTRVLNTYVGVGADGITRVPNGESGIYIDARALSCTVGAPGKDSTTVVSGNIDRGMNIYGAGARVLNTYVGVGVDGTTAVSNKGNVGIFIGASALNCTIGAPGEGSTTLVSGNNNGIVIRGAAARVLNTYVGVAVDGTTAVPNKGQRGIYIENRALDCTIGAPGEGSTTVVSGNSQNGIVIDGVGARVFNTFVGVGADGTTPVPNGGEMGSYVANHDGGSVCAAIPWAAGWAAGIYVSNQALNCTIGDPGVDSTTVVSGNAGYGLYVGGTNIIVANTHVGVATDGNTAAPNLRRHPPCSVIGQVGPARQHHQRQQRQRDSDCVRRRARTGYRRHAERGGARGQHYRPEQEPRVGRRQRRCGRRHPGHTTHQPAHRRPHRQRGHEHNRRQRVACF